VLGVLWGSIAAQQQAVGAVDVSVSMHAALDLNWFSSSRIKELGDFPCQLHSTSMAYLGTTVLHTNVGVFDSCAAAGC
jgi:hypothetical protein